MLGGTEPLGPGEPFRRMRQKDQPFGFKLAPAPHNRAERPGSLSPELRRV